VTSGNLNFSSDDVRLGTAGRGEGIMFWGWLFQDAGVGSPPDSFHSQIFQPSILTADDLVARQKACTWMRKK
jgi:hypothetical protein